MSLDVTGFITWIRTFLDDVYALKSDIPTGVTLDNDVTQNSSNAVKSSGIYTAIDNHHQAIWNPQLNGETGANYKYNYAEANGEGYGKGFILKNGFKNTQNWQLSFEFKHSAVQYTGLIFLCNADTYTTPSSDSSNYSDKSLQTWEGTWIGGERYATYSTGAVDWFDVTVTKIDATHVRLHSTKLNRNTVVEVSWLPNATRLSFGAVHNSSSSGGGTCYVRNVFQVNTLFDSNPYPVGSIYMSVNDVNPANLFGGTWEQIEDTFLLSSGSTYINGDTGGEATHNLTQAELPSFSHSISRVYPSSQSVSQYLYKGTNTNYQGSGVKTATSSYSHGSGQAHNNMPPYLVVNVWKRIA